MPERLLGQSYVKIFPIYANEDLPLLKELEAHLALLLKTSQLIFWTQEDIQIGSERKLQIWNNLNEANVILLLVSSDFFGSIDCEEQVERAIHKTKSGNAYIINIIIRPCYWTESKIAVYSTLLRGLEPITSWANRDEAWSRVIKELHQFIESRYRGRAEIAGAEKGRTLDHYAISNSKPNGVWAWFWRYITRQ